MASSVTEITASKVLVGCTAYQLNGQYKIVAEGMLADEEVIFYQETVTEGNYQIVCESGGRAMKLEPGRDSDIFTLAGNYKFLLGENTDAARKVGYAAV